MNAAAHPWLKYYPAGVRWDAPIEQTILQTLLDRAVDAYGDRPLYEYRGRRVSFREMGDLAARAAAGFVELGIKKGDTVALYLPNTPYHPISFFGALRAGARVTHLSPLDAERDLIYKLQDSGARTLVTTNLFRLLPTALKLLAGGHLDRIIIGDDNDWGAGSGEPFSESKQVISLGRLMERAKPPAQWPDVMPSDIALLQYTGATTGLPKAAVLTHGNLTASVSSYRTWLAGQTPKGLPPDRVIMVLPLFHIFGLSSVMLRHLANGNEMLLRPRFDIDQVIHDIEVNKATSFPGVPTMWIALVNYPGIEKRDLKSLRVIASGGAPLPVEIAERAHKLTGLTLTNGWGMTETSPAGISPPAGPTRKPGTIGFPLPGIVAQIVAADDPRKVLGANEIGELRVSGTNIMQGYWNRPDETAAALVDGFFLTGDIGYYDEDGYFFIVDRKKDMIISGGFNIYPVKLECAIFEHPDVEEALVIGVPDAYRGEAAKAFVKLKAGARVLTIDALREFLDGRLGRHELPSALELCDSLPRTNVGKLSKKELIEAERRKAAQKESANA
ncbi:MAG TPA: dicarboxylate--CoA ligase PimA [Pseudolabrys sp.]|jgi:long-chain acyl-CoA synthetase|nr:dicarboxylate--CoA ligase PimA [Pseudolabrys sp.]